MPVSLAEKHQLIIDLKLTFCVYVELGKADLSSVTPSSDHSAPPDEGLTIDTTAFSNSLWRLIYLYFKLISTKKKNYAFSLLITKLTFV